MSKDFDLDAAIRKIPDFPRKGILFYDITSILTNPPAFAYCVEKFVELHKGWQSIRLQLSNRAVLSSAPR